MNFPWMNHHSEVLRRFLGGVLIVGFFLGQGFNWGSWGLTHDARGKCHCSAGEKPLLQRLTQTGDPHRPMHHDCPPPGLDCREVCLPGTEETCARWGGRSSPRNLGSRHKITCLLMGCSSPTKLGSQTGFHLQTVRQPRVLGRNPSETRSGRWIVLSVERAFSRPN